MSLGSDGKWIPEAVAAPTEFNSSNSTLEDSFSLDTSFALRPGTRCHGWCVDIEREDKSEPERNAWNFCFLFPFWRGVLGKGGKTPTI